MFSLLRWEEQWDRRTNSYSFSCSKQCLAIEEENIRENERMEWNGSVVMGQWELCKSICSCCSRIMIVVSMWYDVIPSLSSNRDYQWEREIVYYAVSLSDWYNTRMEEWYERETVQLYPIDEKKDKGSTTSTVEWIIFSHRVDHPPPPSPPSSFLPSPMVVTHSLSLSLSNITMSLFSLPGTTTLFSLPLFFHSPFSYPPVPSFSLSLLSSNILISLSKRELGEGCASEHVWNGTSWLNYLPPSPPPSFLLSLSLLP